jgi:hypothetical protein
MKPLTNKVLIKPSATATFAGSGAIQEFRQMLDLLLASAIFKSLLYIAFFFSLIVAAKAQTTTVSGATSWTNALSWSAGVPTASMNATVNHAIELNAHLSLSASYVFNAPVTDKDGGTQYNISLNSIGALDANANSRIEGYITATNTSYLTIKSGSTFIVGATGGTYTSKFTNQSTILIEEGATLIINGDLSISNEVVLIINGTLIINGKFLAENNSKIEGTGTMTTTGSLNIKDNSMVFGSANSCLTGPCSGNNLCVSNIVGSAQTICAEQAAAGLTGSTHSGYTYQWQSSTTSATSNFTNISGATGQNYSPGALSNTTWFRRIASFSNCVATSIAVQITVNPYVMASVSISASPTGTICPGSSVTFTASPVNGGSAPAYQWKLNGNNVGTNSSTYTNSTLTNGSLISCVMTSNYACVSGNPATSNAIVMSVTASSGGWLGRTSSAWNTASNWCGGVPTSSTNVVISSGAINMPNITTTGAVCNSIAISEGASITIANTGALSLRGNIANNGSFVSNGTVILNGTTAQGINGIAEFHHLTLNNAAGSTLLSETRISGILTLMSGVLTSNGKLSVDLNTGAISGEGTGSVVGALTVNKTISSAKYHYISAPLNGLTVAEWNDDVPIKAGKHSNLYGYNEANPNPDKSIGWEPISNLATALVPMKGYALYFNSATNIDVTGTYEHTISLPSVSLTNTVSGDANSDGWHLIGNPYPSTLDWDATSGWTKTGITNAIYYWDPLNNRYASYTTGVGTNGGSRYIPSMQGFWVKVSNSSTTGTLGMNKSARVTTHNPAVWRTTANGNILKMSVTNGTESDETAIRLMDGGMSGFNEDLDAFKMENTGNTPSLYTALEETKYSIKTLSDDLSEYIIPLHLKAGSPGSYTLSAGQIDKFDYAYMVNLRDKLLDSIHDLRANAQYKFQIGSGEGKDRFEIILMKAISFVIKGEASSNVAIRSFENTIHCEFENPPSSSANIEVYNLLGQKEAEVLNADISSGNYSFMLPVRTGIYIVKVVLGGNVYCEKIYLW